MPNNENEIPKGYTLLNKPLITVSNENETKYNRAPVVREISFEGAENEVEVLKFLLNRLSRDMESLLETLDLLDKASIQEQRKITIPFIKEVIAAKP